MTKPDLEGNRRQIEILQKESDEISERLEETKRLVAGFERELHTKQLEINKCLMAMWDGIYIRPAGRAFNTW